MEIDSFDLDDYMAAAYAQFFEIYEHENSIFTDLTEKTVLGEGNKTCRFCGKRFPEVRFTKKAHVIPQSIGNGYLLSNFECNDCNAFFGTTYEDSFAKYLSVIRPFVGISNANKSTSRRVKHKEFKSGLEITSGENSIDFFTDRSKPSPIRFEDDNKKMVVEATVPPFSPLYVFKMFIKIGISMLRESELENFLLTRSFLLDNSQNSKVRGYELFKVSIINVNGPAMWSRPFAVLHTKKASMRSSLFPEKIFSLYFASRVFQIVIPFNKNDNFLIGQKFKVPLCPIPINKDHFEKYGTYGISRRDFSSDEVVRDDKHTLTLSITDTVFFPPSQ